MTTQNETAALIADRIKSLGETLSHAAFKTSMNDRLGFLERYMQSKALEAVAAFVMQWAREQTAEIKRKTERSPAPPLPGDYREVSQAAFDALMLGTSPVYPTGLPSEAEVAGVDRDLMSTIVTLAGSKDEFWVAIRNESIVARALIDHLFAIARGGTRPPWADVVKTLGLPASPGRSANSLMRAEIWDFAQIMERELRNNDERRGGNSWKMASGVDLLAGLAEDVRKLNVAFLHGNKEKIIEQCADVANMAMMIADVVRIARDKGEPDAQGK